MEWSATLQVPCICIPSGQGPHRALEVGVYDIADPRISSWWTETDWRADSLHQSDAPLWLTWCSWLLTCAHTAWKSTSAPLLFCTSGEETVENLKISRGQLAPCQEMRIKRQQTVRSDGCKVPAPNAGFLLASMPSYCRFKPIECSYSESVPVSVPQDKIRGSAITTPPPRGIIGQCHSTCTSLNANNRWCTSLEEHCGETRQVHQRICVLGPFHLNLKCDALYWPVRPSTVVHFPDDVGSSQIISSLVW